MAELMFPGLHSVSVHGTTPQPRRRSRSPSAELHPFRERDDHHGGSDQPRYQPRTCEDERTIRAQGGDWPDSRDRRERHTVRESRYGERDHRSDRDTDPMPLNRYFADSENRRSDRRYDPPDDREQGRGAGLALGDVVHRWVEAGEEEGDELTTANTS